MSVAAMIFPTLTATPLFVSVPAGSDVIMTPSSALAGPVPVGGVSLGSVNGKSASANVYFVSSRIVIVLSALSGASLTELMVMVKVCGALVATGTPLSTASTTMVAVPCMLAAAV